MTSFAQKVYGIVRRIPKGRVMTYARVARLAGRPRASRAVGNVLHRNPCSFFVHGLAPSERVPCHRVVKSDGRPGGFAPGTGKKIALLKKEGVLFRNGRIAGKFS